MTPAQFFMVCPRAPTAAAAALHEVYRRHCRQFDVSECTASCRAVNAARLGHTDRRGTGKSRQEPFSLQASDPCSPFSRSSQLLRRMKVGSALG